VHCVSCSTQKLIVTSEETRLKHSVLGPDGLRPRWIPPVSQVKVLALSIMVCLVSYIDELRLANYRLVHVLD
jgi:hypothetical protein